MLLELQPNILCQGEVKSKLLPSNFFVCFHCEADSRGGQWQNSLTGATARCAVVLFSGALLWDLYYALHCLHFVSHLYCFACMRYRTIIYYIKHFVSDKHITHLPSNATCFTVKKSQNLSDYSLLTAIFQQHIVVKRSSVFKTSPFLILREEKDSSKFLAISVTKIEENKIFLKIWVFYLRIR